jgi:Protein of unknown function DUF262/Protein of unknown function (DUF1524)
MDIAPDKQNIDRVFSGTVYHIDFYQRDYKWTEEPVQRLLDDIYYQFDQEYQKRQDLDPSPQIIAYYPWYYLNTYVTNTIEGKVYIVDGQQRLTTLTLILLKLYHLATHGQSKAQKWLESKLLGFSGMDCQFWMNHERHSHVLESLKEDPDRAIDTSTGITAENLVKNYKTISNWLDTRLTSQHRLETFIHYFLYRLVLINLAVEQTDVPMVFEVINDRGVRLKPYEILKGKLLGQIDKIELDQRDYNGHWEAQVQAINSFSPDEIDNFFRYYLKAKFADSRKDGTRFDGDYHREMFTDTMNQQLQILHNPAGVKTFLDSQFKYFTQLYIKLLKAREKENPDHPHVFLNRLNEMDGQFLLILSSCHLDDPEEFEKIRIISAELDRFFVLLQLQNAYDSNALGERIFRISDEIRDKTIADIRPAFDRHLMEELSKRRMSGVSEPFQYSFFRNAGISLNSRFKRYFFARIERFLATGMNIGEKYPIEDLVTKRGAVNGFHIEHILSNNAENLKLFDGDSDRFEQEHNRLGGLLLLRGQANIASGNEPYTQKLKTYANTLYWNETLRTDTYKANFDIKGLQSQLGLQPYDEFGPDELESRQSLLFKICCQIWK